MTDLEYILLFNSIPFLKKSEKRIVLYPYGHYGKIVFDELAKRDVNIDQIIDNYLPSNNFIVNVEQFFDLTDEEYIRSNVIFILCTANIDLYYTLRHTLFDHGVAETQILDLFMCEQRQSYNSMSRIDTVFDRYNHLAQKLTRYSEIGKIQVINLSTFYFKKIIILLQIMGIEYETYYTLPALDHNNVMTIVASDIKTFLIYSSKMPVECRKRIEYSEEILHCFNYCGLIVSIRTLANMNNKCFCFTFPTVSDAGVLSDVEKGIDAYFNVKNESRVKWLKHNLPHIEYTYSHISDYSNEYIEYVFTGPNAIFDGFDIYQADYHNQYVNIDYGIRKTTDAPLFSSKRLIMIGSSNIYGYGVEDKYTIASYIQRIINLNHQNFQVFNYGVRGLQTYAYPLKISNLDLSDDDIIVVQFPGEMKKLVLDLCLIYGVDYYPLEFAVQRPHCYGELFFDRSHFNHIGNKLAADILYSCIFKPNVINTCTQDDYLDVLTHGKIIAAEIKNYVDELSTFALENGSTGCIVMNANPFTLGHQFLVESASSNVDNLLIIVLDEDKSFFSTEARFQMVRSGTQHLKNVQVIHGGKYCLSVITFPEYFDKDDLHTELIHPEKDVLFFAKYIAPALNICRRYVGEEPYDNVTRQYNECMKKVFPSYGIELIEVPRKKWDKYPISASFVRKMLNSGNTKDILNLVPQTTFDYLLQNGFISPYNNK